MQILADVTGRKISVVENPRNAGAVGAAVVALIGLGERLDWDKDHLACGYGELVELTLSQIKNNDAAVLASLKSIIAAL